MNNYRVNNSALTMGFITASFVATALSLNVHQLPADNLPRQNLKQNSYHSVSVSPTFDQYSNIFSGEFTSSLDPLVEAVTNFYSKLLSSQEHLEPEFEQVLNENLWELYES